MHNLSPETLKRFADAVDRAADRAADVGNNDDAFTLIALRECLDDEKGTPDLA